MGFNLLLLFDGADNRWILVDEDLLSEVQREFVNQFREEADLDDFDMDSFEDKMDQFEEERKDISHLLTNEKEHKNIDIDQILEGLNNESSIL